MYWPGLALLSLKSGPMGHVCPRTNLNRRLAGQCSEKHGSTGVFSNSELLSLRESRNYLERGIVEHTCNLRTLAG